MKLRNLLIALPITVIALPVLAQSAAIDADGDGMYSLPEVQAALPDMTMDGFTVLDANGDGLLDAEEIAIAVEAGVLPADEN